MVEKGGGFGVVFAGFGMNVVGDGGGWFFCRIVGAELGEGDSGDGYAGGSEEEDIGERIWKAEMKRRELGIWV